MKILELFCGYKSFSKVAEEFGYDVFTVDNNRKFNPNLNFDIMYITKDIILSLCGPPDIIWCSPPCETFSLCGHNYFMGYPTNSKCYIGLALVYKCIEIIRFLKPRFWFIENPRGGLRNVWFMKPLPRYTVTYCQYGFKYMKPTDIWTNLSNWIPKSCKNGDSCHISAPRGSRKGVQGEKSREERGKIPRDLCIELIECIKKGYICD